MRILSFCGILLLSVGICSPTIVIDKIYSSYVQMILKNKIGCRIYSYQHELRNPTTDTIKTKGSYIFSIDGNHSFEVHYDSQQLAEKPYLTILASPFDGSQSTVYSINISEDYYHCNENELLVKEITQLQDSCISVIVKYKGSGGVYALNRLEGDNVIEPHNIIYEGLYLGKHDHEEVSTIICGLYEKLNYILYLTVVDGKCIRTPLQYPFVASAYSQQSKWSVSSNSIWLGSIDSNSINHGVHYRRYGGVVYPTTFINQLQISSQGVLITDIEKVEEKVKERLMQDAGMSDDTSHEILNNNIIWRESTFENGVFKGLLMLLGKGNVYVYCSKEKSGVSFQDVVDKGEIVGYFEEDAIDITVSGLDSNDYAVYVVLEYQSQYFGPFYKTI